MKELKAVQKIFQPSHYIRDLEFGDEGEFCGKVTLWGNECDITLMYGYGDDEDEKPNLELFSQAFEKVENALVWLDANKPAIANHFDDEVLYGLNEWVKKEIAKNGKAVISGVSFNKEITLEEFTQSLYFLSVNFCFVEEDDLDNMNYQFTLASEDPDFLSGNIATVEVDNGELCSGICIDG